MQGYVFIAHDLVFEWALASESWRQRFQVESEGSFESFLMESESKVNVVTADSY